MTKSLHAKDGLIVGIDKKDNYHRVNGYQHLLLIAPTELAREFLL